MRRPALFALLLTLLACLVPASTWAAVPLRSKDGTIEISLPDGWQQATLAGPGKIQATAPDKDAFAIVVSEAKIDFNHTKLDDYVAAILKLEQDKSTMTDRVVDPPRKFKILGHNAVEVQMRGTLGNVKLVFIKTFVESDTHWNQIQCWTTPSHAAASRADFDAIVKSFRELPSTKKY